MSNDYSIHNLENYIVGNISFTKKEFDVIAYIIKNNSYKNASLALGVSVEELTTTAKIIIKKIRGSSIDDIIGFFAATNYHNIISKYYSEDLIAKNIEDLLKNIQFEKSDAFEKYFIFDSAQSESSKIKINVLKKILERIGIKADDIKSFEDFKHPERTIILTDDDNFSATMSKLKNPYSLFVCESITDTTINCFSENTSNFYFVALDIINEINYSKKNSKLIFNFKKQYKIESLFKSFKKDERILRSKSLKESKINKITWIFILIFLLLLTSFTYFYKNYYFVDTLLENIHINKNNITIPRIGLQNAILRSINSQENVPTKFVVLVGAGGSGKTYFVKSFINTHIGKIKWIINSETEGTLMNSLMEFAHNLSKLTKDNARFLLIKNIKIISTKKQKLFQFILEKLKQIGRYQIIFDNADKIDLIMKFFPKDRNNLGNGTIFFTIRNLHNDNNVYFNENELVYVYNLKPKEQMQLFTSVLYKNSIVSLSEYKQTSDFLKQLLPYPLDILSAAHYIKNTSISLDEYLERVYRLKSSFENSMNNSLSGSKQTRNAIITSSISSLVQENILFKKLLLSLTLVDSQEIPKQILYLKNKDEIVDQFIFSLKKHFIADVKNDKIYVHRSVQNISKQFLIANMDYATIKNVIFNLTNTFKKLQDIYTINKETRLAVQLRVHVKHLLSKIDKLLLNEDCTQLKPTLYLIIAKINFNNISNYISAVKYYNLAIEHNNISKSLTNIDIAEAEQNLGWIQLYWNQYDISEKHINNSLNICKNHPECKNILITNIRNLGKAAGIKGNLQLSMKYLNSALTLIGDPVDDKNKNIKAGILNQIASAYLRNHVNKKEKNLHAISLLEKSLELTNSNEMLSLSKSTKTPNIGSWAPPSRWRIAQNYFMLQRYDEAIDNINESDFLLKKLDNYKYKALQKLLNLRERAKITLRQGKVEKALELFDSAINLTENSSIGMDTWKSKIYRAEVLMRLGKYKEALNDASSVIKHTHGNNNYSMLLHTHNILHAAIIYKLLGNHEKAEEILKIFFKQSKHLIKKISSQKIQNEIIRKNLLVITKETKLQQKINNGIEIFALLIGKNNDFIKNHLIKYLKKENVNQINCSQQKSN